jgi:SET domain-containing protein
MHRGQNCKNGESCTNQVLQQCSYAGECKPSLKPRKGWGLAILNNKKKGNVLQEYVGEVVSKQELDSRQDKSYAFFLGRGWFVNSRLKGNDTQFVNLCCQLNCRFKSWKVNGYTPHLAFCAARDIKAGEFLSCDYRWDTSKCCQCDSPNCKGRLNGQRERRSHGRPPSKKGHKCITN